MRNRGYSRGCNVIVIVMAISLSFLLEKGHWAKICNQVYVFMVLHVLKYLADHKIKFNVLIKELNSTGLFLIVV